MLVACAVIYKLYTRINRNYLRWIWKCSNVTINNKKMLSSSIYPIVGGTRHIEIDLKLPRSNVVMNLMNNKVLFSLFSLFSFFIIFSTRNQNYQNRILYLKKIVLICRYYLQHLCFLWHFLEFSWKVSRNNIVSNELNLN